MKNTNTVKRTFKKSLAFALLLTLCVGLLCVTALADYEEGQTLADIVAAGGGELGDAVYIVSETILIDNEVTLTGGTITRDSSTHSIFEITENGSLTLNGVTITGTNESIDLSVERLCAIKSAGTLVVDADTTISGFYGEENGGALFVTGGTAEIAGTLEGNHASQGGGLYMDGGTVTVTGTLKDNVVNANFSDGGGAFVGGGTLILNGATVEGNTAGHGGGIAVLGENANLTMENTVIRGNDAATGGGIALGYNHSNDDGSIGTVKLISGQITGNTASRDRNKMNGGGIYLHQGCELDLQNVAIINNKAIWGYSQNHECYIGGGVWFCPLGNGQFYATNGALIAGNSAGRVGDDVSSQTHEDYLPNKVTMNLATRLYDGTPVNWYEDLWSNQAGMGQIGLTPGRYHEGQEAIPDMEAWMEDWIENWPDRNTHNLFGGIYVEMGLKSGADSAKAGDAYYTLIISDNEAGYGGGIACNGTLILGEDRDTELTVNKVWADGSAPEGVSVTVNLLRNGETVVDSVVLSADNSWSYTFKDLSGDYTWTVEEVAIDGYTATYSEVDENGVITITNTPFTPPPTPQVNYTSVSVNKVWAGDEGVDRPESVTVQLYANGAAYGASVTLNEANGWSYTWGGLLADGYTYTVVETDVPDGYTSEVTGSGTSYTIVNTYDSTTTIPDGDIPLGPQPELDIPDMDVPLDSTPKTGDDSHDDILIAMMLVSAFGLASICLITVAAKIRRMAVVSSSNITSKTGAAVPDWESVNSAVVDADVIKGERTGRRMDICVHNAAEDGLVHEPPD